MNLEMMGYAHLARAGHDGHGIHIGVPVPKIDPAHDGEANRATLDAVMSNDFWENRENQECWRRKWNVTNNRNGDWIAAGHLFKVLYSFHRLVRRMDELDFEPSTIILDSRGGDADAAISIAKIVRQSALFERVPVEARVAEGIDSVCFSACVVIFSAGYRRSLEFDINGNPELPSRLGIHGPGQYDAGNGRYDSSAENGEIRRVSRRLRAWFREIGVSDKIVDDMFAVPYNDIRLLTKEELVGYGLYAD